MNSSLQILGKHSSFILKINNTKITSADSVELLQIAIDKNHIYIYTKHINELLLKLDYELYVLGRLRKYISLRNVMIVDDSLITSELHYCSIWMYVENMRWTFLKTTQAHRPASRICEMPWQELLDTGSNLSIHLKHLYYFVVEIYNSLNSPFLEEKESIWEKRNPSGSRIKLPAIKAKKW